MTYWEKDLETYYHYLSGGCDGMVDMEDMDDEYADEREVYHLYFFWEDDFIGEEQNI